jgi:hypothetical protein
MGLTGKAKEQEILQNHGDDEDFLGQRPVRIDYVGSDHNAHELGSDHGNSPSHTDAGRTLTLASEIAEQEKPDGGGHKDANNEHQTKFRLADGEG